MQEAASHGAAYSTSADLRMYGTSHAYMGTAHGAHTPYSCVCLRFRARRRAPFAPQTNGPEAADTAVLLNALASLLLDLGQLGEAEQHYRQVHPYSVHPYQVQSYWYQFYECTLISYACFNQESV